MRYLDVYKDCKMINPLRTCGIMVSSIRLCNSYKSVYEELSDEELSEINNELENNI